MNASTKNPALMIGIVLAGVFLLTRKAGATNARTTSPQSAAMRYSISPGTALAGGAGKLSSNASALTTILGAGTSLLNAINRTPAVSTNFALDVPILNTAQEGQEGYGWQYFSDGSDGGGTAISPNGSYFDNGVKVWDESMNNTITVSGYPTDYQYF